MIALIRKELRELALPAVALVCCAVIIAGMDLMYNLYYPQYKGQGIALGIWLVISVVVAFLGGASAIARENRARMVFLSEWPVSRGTLWVAKAAVSVLLTTAVILVGFGVCMGAARVAHYVQDSDVREAIQGLSYILPLCFAFGMLWSGVIGSVLGAGAVGFVSAVALIAGPMWFLAFYTPAHWGPWVGNTQPVERGTPLITLIVLALVLLIGVWTFVRYPVLEGKRRALAAVGLLLAMTVGGTALLLGYRVVAGRPSLERQVTEAGLSDDGRTIYFSTAGGKGDRRGLIESVRSSGLWVMPATGGAPRLVCRLGESGGLTQTGNALLVEWKGGGGGGYWKYDLNRRKLQKLPDYLLEVSPDGRYEVTMGQDTVAVRDARGRVVKALEASWGGITIDNRRAYYVLRDGSVRALDLQTRQETDLGRVGDRAYPMAVSPDGKWLALTYRNMDVKLWYTVLLNLQTRAQKKFVQTAAFGAGFVDNRHLWVREKHEGVGAEGLAIVDLEAGRVVRRLGRGSSRLWHREGVPYVVFALEIMQPGPRPGMLQGTDVKKVFIAKRDGTGARLLREERRQMLGMTADGKIVMWDKGRTFVSWDPVRGEEKVLVR